MNTVFHFCGSLAERCRRLYRYQGPALLVLLVIIAVGATLRCRGLVERPLWEDESYTWNDSQVPYLKLLWWKHDPRHGPLSHIMVRHSMQLFGTDAPWAMRAPSLLCGIFCIPAVFWLGRTIHSDAVGLLAATMVAIDANMIDQSQQARMYTMLALVWMLVIGQAIRLLRDPPQRRRGWIILGVLLSVLLSIHFSAIGLWIALPAAALVLVGYHRLRGEAEVHSGPILHGLKVTYLTATVLSARGLWKFYHFLTDGHEGEFHIAESEKLRSLYGGIKQLTGAGAWTPAVLLLAVLGLWILARRCRVSAILLTTIAAVALLMIYRGQSVHRVFHVRYFTVLEPTLWIALSAACVLATSLPRRAVMLALLLVTVGFQASQASQFDRWNDQKLWRFVRSASALIHHERQSGELFICTPNLHLVTLARYYDLVEADDDRLQWLISQHDSLPGDVKWPATWLVAFMHDQKAEGELRRLLSTTQTSQTLGVDVESIVALVKKQGHAVVRLSPERIDCWTYSSGQDRFERLVPLLASRPAGTSN